MLKLNGSILSRDHVVATVRDGMITESDSSLLPFYLKRTGDVEGWLTGRAIDSHRTNSRLLKKALRLTTADDAELVLKVNAVTITDTYWFRQEGESLRYEDVRFNRNLFDKLALTGDPDSFNQPYSPTPELTNIGSFEKCWRLVDGIWWMVKQGNALEHFSELLISRLGKALELPMAEYQWESGVILSPDFTCGASVNYESAESFVGDDEDYSLNFDTFWNLSPELAEQYLAIIYMDTLCFNMDRHTKNYGVLRDVESGRILRMAPNFDNNIALFARGMPKNLARKSDKLVELFCQLLEQDQRALNLARKLPVPIWELVEQCVNESPIPMVAGDVACFIMSGSEQVQDHIQTLVQRLGIEPGM